MSRVTVERCSFVDDFPTAIPGWEEEHPRKSADDKMCEWVNLNINPEYIISITREVVWGLSRVTVYYRMRVE